MGDYDGDQTTVKIVFTQEANEECKKAMNSKSYFINASGQNIRKVENEAIQTFYTLTKESNSTNSRPLTDEEKKYFLSFKPEDITFTNMVDWFGDLVDLNTQTKSSINSKNHKSKFRPTDTFTLTHSEYPLVKDKINTTLGRFIYTKLIVEMIHFENILPFINFVLDDGGHGKVEKTVANALKEDKITVDQMYKYVDTRDWLGLQLHSVITTSFTPGVLKVPKEVQALKKELLKKYKTELENGDNHASEIIEKELIAKTKEALKDDIGMDLYVSGARGSIGNNYKNMYLMRGAIKNNMTGKYEIITGSLLDGLQKENIDAHSNSILSGAFPKAV